MVNFNDKIFTKIIKYFEFHYLWRLIGILGMAGNDNKIMRRRLANAYLSSVISISLVLLLVGVASLLLVNAKGVSDYFKENMQVSVLMKHTVSDEDALEYRAGLDKLHFISEFLLKTEVMDGEQFEAAMSGTPTFEELEEMNEAKARRSREENDERRRQLAIEEQKKREQEEAAKAAAAPAREVSDRPIEDAWSDEPFGKKDNDDKGDDAN